MVDAVISHHQPISWLYSSAIDDWSYSPDIESDDYKLVPLDSFTSSYRSMSAKINPYLKKPLIAIYELQNPYLYAQFKLKKEEFQSRGVVQTLELYHATTRSDIHSILSGNLDRRRPSGQGVRFSSLPSYATNKSSKSNKVYTVIVADVLVGNVETVDQPVALPSDGNDTTVRSDGKTYIKYYDYEFYPKYLVYCDNDEERYFYHVNGYHYAFDDYYDIFYDFD